MKSRWVAVVVGMITFGLLTAGSVCGSVRSVVQSEEEKEIVFFTDYGVSKTLTVGDLYSVSTEGYGLQSSKTVVRKLKVSARSTLEKSLRELAYVPYKSIKPVGDWYELVTEYREGEPDYDGILRDLEFSTRLNVSEYVDYDCSEAEKEFAELEEWKNWKVCYESVNCTFGFDEVKKFVQYEDGIVVNSDYAEVLAKRVSRVYNTVGKKHYLKSASGKRICVEGGLYGWEVDQEREAEWLRESIRKERSTKKRVPEFTHVAHSGIYGKNDVGDTYVEVSIPDQHIWYYCDGKLVRESDCVTGTKGKSDTPTGVWYVTEIRPQGKVLVGTGYRTKVDQWIRLTDTGIGLHDADWRSSFGGSIYRYSGSHGCVNLPSSFAEFLVNEVYFGMPVVVRGE